MDHEQKAIERIKLASEMSLNYYGQPLICTYSGGKDSDVMLELFKRSRVPFEAHHSHTTADAPPTVYHIREVFRRLELEGVKCTIDYHVQLDGSRTTMWNLIPKKLMPPTRKIRYCCSILKESGTPNRMVATGIRWDESNARKERESFEVLAPRKKDAVRVSDEKMLLTDNDDRRMLFERCEMKAETVVNPIIDWKDREIWDFYQSECQCHNPLYGMGFTRVGCIGCPMAGKGRWKEFHKFPQYKDMYINAFGRMLQARKEKGLGLANEMYKEWKSGEDAFLWWMEDKNVSGQLELEFNGMDISGIKERRELVGE